MTKFSYLWEDDGILGDFKLTCDECGTVYSKDTFDTQRGNLVVCSKCGAKYNVYISIIVQRKNHD